MMCRYYRIGHCLNAPFSLSKPSNCTYLAGQAHFKSVCPACSGLPHPQLLNSPCRRRLLLSDTVCYCRMCLLDNESRILITFGNEALPRRCRPALRSRTDPEVCPSASPLIMGAPKSAFDKSAIMSVKIPKPVLVNVISGGLTPAFTYKEGEAMGAKIISRCSSRP